MLQGKRRFTAESRFDGWRSNHRVGDERGDCRHESQTKQKRRVGHAPEKLPAAGIARAEGDECDDAGSEEEKRIERQQFIAQRCNLTDAHDDTQQADAGQTNANESGGDRKYGHHKVMLALFTGWFG